LQQHVGAQHDSLYAFYPLPDAVVNAAQTKQTDAHFMAWADFISDVIDGQKKGDNTGFLKAI